jgi:hypothetical protein
MTGGARASIVLNVWEAQMDPTMVAATAVGTVLPYLATVGKNAAQAAAGAAAKSVWEWVKGKLTSEAGKEAVKDLESAPDDAVNQDAAKAALSKVLRSDPSALSQLAELLAQAGVTTTQSANISGDRNIVGQAAGGSSVTINAGRASRPKGGST